jgi:hypothetical protein
LIVDETQTGELRCRSIKPPTQSASTTVDRVKTEIKDFVRYVTDNEPWSRLYCAWQEVEDPTKFVRLLIFEHEAAYQAHGRVRPPS